MLKKEFIVNSDEGFHLRPAGVLCNVAKKFDCITSLIYDNKEIVCTNPIFIVAACIKGGSKYTIKCNGPQENECLTAITEAEANNYKI